MKKASQKQKVLSHHINNLNQKGHSSSSFNFISKYYELARNKLEHEDNLLNHRISWLLTIQGLLFATFGIIITSENTTHPLISMPHVAIPIFGISIIIISSFGILAALFAIKEIENDWDDNFNYNATNKIILDHYLPSFRCKTGPHIFGFIPPLGIPIVFLTAWCVIIHYL